MNIKLFLVFLSIIQTSIAYSQNSIHQKEELPNIVIILADDLGYGDLSCLNSDSKIKTPVLDDLAESGMIFTDAHSSSAVCSPTRYSLLTGRYNWRSNLKRGVLWYWDEPLIEENRLTIGDLLSGCGYTTACIGKWHLGWNWPSIDRSRINDELNIGEYNKNIRDNFSKKIVYSEKIDDGPVTRGFDYYYGDDVPGFPPYCFIENDRTTAIPDLEKPDSIFGYSDGGPMIAGWDWEELLPAYTNKAVQFILGKDDYGAKLRDRDRPFFLYFSLSAPHVPIAPTDKFKGSSNAGAYGDFVQQIDWTVGKILDALEQNNQRHNTLVIFTSDNGSPGRSGEVMVGEYNSVREFGHNPSYIFRGTKTDIWEGGHRVPFIVSWPAKIGSGITQAKTICQTDLIATCADIVNKKLPDDAGEDSYSILPLFTGTKSGANKREATVHHSLNGDFAIRKNSWKLILCSGSGGVSRPRNIDADKEGGPPYQLYNLESDPGEKVNLYSLHPEKVIELGQLLNKYIANGRSTPGKKQMNYGEVPLFTINMAGVKKIADTSNGQKELDNLFYCQNTLSGFDNYPKTPVQKTRLMKEIGFDGLEGFGYDGFFELKDAIEGQGLSMPVNYVPIEFQDDGELDDVSVNEIKSMIKSTAKGGVIYFSISHKAHKDKTDSEDKIVASALRKLADLASMYKVKLCSYPHVNTYCETTMHSVTLAKLVDRKNFGASLNLCHLLKVEGSEGLQNKIKEFTPFLFAVNICGADDGDTRQYGWNRLIQPLGEGSFDTYNFVKLLRDNGYTGPIGLQCYNLKGDIVKTLTQSMNTWKDYKKRYTKGK